MKIAEYNIVRKLGDGGMSEVWEAENLRLGSRCALKVYCYPKQDEAVRERFLVEGRLLAKLAHPRIVKVSDLGTDDAGRPYFAMDLVCGPDGQPQTLANALADSVDEEMVARWYDDIRDGLAYIHAQGVVHRDLKLQNVMIGPDGHAVLMDFGISRVFKPDDKGCTVVDAVQTLVSVRNGTSPVMGSLGYMAPELEMGAAATPKSDWYALGVIVYKLLTGMWCDARTDIVAELETYDPVWRRILPKLLHANPEGRECLSFAEEKQKDREAAELKAENRLMRMKERGRFARHLARYLAGAFVLSSLACCLLGWKLMSATAQLQVPEFDSIFVIPSYAGDEISDYEAALCDTWLITRDAFKALRAEGLSRAAVQGQVEELEHKLDTLEKSDDIEIAANCELKCVDDEIVRKMIRGGLSRLRKWREAR